MRNPLRLTLLPAIHCCIVFAACSTCDFQNVPSNATKTIEPQKSTLTPAIRERAEKLNILIDDTDNTTTLPYPIEAGPFGEHIVHYAIAHYEQEMQKENHQKELELSRKEEGKEEENVTIQFITYLVHDFQNRFPVSYKERLRKETPQHDGIRKMLVDHKSYTMLQLFIDLNILTAEDDLQYLYQQALETDSTPLLEIYSNLLEKRFNKTLNIPPFIHLTISKQYANLFEYAILHFPLRDTIDDDGNNLLHQVIMKKWGQGTAILLKDANQQFIKESINQKNNQENTPLMLAIHLLQDEKNAQGFFKSIQSLIKHGADPKLPDHNGISSQQMFAKIKAGHKQGEDPLRDRAFKLLEALLKQE
eukprot:gene2954-3687_t